MKRPRKIITRAIVFLLLGAIINVGISIVLSVSKKTGWHVGYLPQAGAKRIPRERWMVTEYQSFGALELLTCTDVTQVFAVPIAAHEATTSLAPATECLPNWSFVQRSGF